MPNNLSEYSNFIQLEQKEVLMKLMRLADHKELIKLWVKGTETIDYRVREVKSIKVKERSLVLISLFSEGEETDKDLIGKNAYLSFYQSEMDYFSEAFVSKDEFSGDLVLVLEKEVFRSEKRDNERLLTFPHYKVYVYFKFEKTEEAVEQSNVIQLTSPRHEMKELKKKQDNKNKKSLAKKLDLSEDELFEYRVLDISRSGIAFRVDEEDKSFFKEKANYKFYIVFENSVFKVSDASLVYCVDYLTGTEKNTFKLGLKFKPVDNLSTLIMETLRNGESEVEIQKEFEEFIED